MTPAFPPPPPTPEEKEKQQREEELQRIAAMRERLGTEERERQEKHAAEKETLSRQQQKMVAQTKEESITRQEERKEWREKYQEKKREERELTKKTEKMKQEEQQRERLAETHIALVEQTHRESANRMKEEVIRHRTEIRKDGARRLQLLEASARKRLQKEEKKCADIEMECRKLPLSLARQTIGRARAELEHIRQKERGAVEREKKILEEGARRSLAAVEKELSMRLRHLEEERVRAIAAAADREQGKIA